jgi:hypothetical protein
MIKPVANKEEKNDRAESKAAINGNQVPSKDITAAGTHGGGLSGSGRQQRRVGLALIAVSLLTIVAAGAWLGPDPATGITQWIARGFIQSVYGALLALFLWTVVWRRRAISYLLLFGVTCICIAAWDTGAGIYANRVRLEANNMLITFRDTPLNVQDLAGTIERNPYVEAYMIMRDAQWELHNRLDQRMADYGASYRTYVENGAFLDIGRLQGGLEPYRALHQIGNLEDQLTRIESNPIEAGDLLWTANLLNVDAVTRVAYIQDLHDAIEAANGLQTEQIAGERHTLARIKQSLQVLIDAKGRYSFADGRVVFDDPADAALFAGRKSPSE